MNLLARSADLEVRKVLASPTLIILLMSPVATAMVLFWMFKDSSGLVSLFLLFNVYIITVMNTSLSIVHERETGTLTALAVTPMDLQLTLWTKALVSLGFALLTSMAIALLAGRSQASLLVTERILGVAGVVLMSGFLFTAVAVMISTYSANVKQVEQVGTGVVMALLLLLMLPLERLPQSVSRLLSWIPVLNSRFLLEVLVAPGTHLEAIRVWLPILVNSLAGIILLALAIRFFKIRYLR